MIEFINISKKFKNNFWEKPNHVLSEVSFAIKEGDLVGFLGANGAGKTTLIKILMDFSRQDSGSVTFSKILGKTRKEVHSNIGYLPERPYLYPYLTGREFLDYIAKLHQINGSITEVQINYWSELLKIDQALDWQIRTYSKGMQQRLGFISAIIHSPKFIVLDEPLSGLDPIGRREFKRIMKDLNKSGVTVFFSSHVVPDVEEICNKVVFIESGKLAYQGSIDQILLEHAKNKYRIKYFLNGELYSEDLAEELKDNKISELLKLNANILELEKESLNLEEIFYKTKK